MFILAAPSGSGKDTLIRRAMDSLDGLEHSVSYTTRPARIGEVDGRDYHFVDRQRFEEKITAQAFLEWAEYNGNLYGTAADPVKMSLSRGTDLLFDIEFLGTERLLNRCPEAHAILVLPPSYLELEKRLTDRGLDEPPDIARRLQLSLWEIERYGMFQYAIINDDLDRASQALAAIILEKRQRVARQERAVQAVVEDFRRSADR
jgi:guanylate kinase